MVRVVSGLSDCILVGNGNWHDINLHLSLAYLLDLTIFLGKHLEPESTDVLAVELHLDVWRRRRDNNLVVLLVEAVSCLGQGYVFQEVADVHGVFTNHIIRREEISIIELNGELSNLPWI